MTEISVGLKKKITKRGLLKGAGAAAVAGGTFGLGLELMAHSETKIDFSTPGADYRLLVGTHGSESLNIVTPLSGKDVPDDTTVFEIETGTLPYLDPKIFPRIGKLYYGVKEVEPFLRDPVKKLKEKGLPMVLTDIPASSLDPSLATVIMGSLVPGVGLFFLLHRERNPTRRKFILAGALSVLGAGVARHSSGMILGFLQRSLSEPWAQKAARANHQLELFRPEDLVATFRNSIIAAKTLGLEPQLPTNPLTDKSKMLMMYGAGHIALPEYMKWGKQAILDYLSLYPKTFIDKTFGLDNPHLHSSVILTPETDGEVKVEVREDKDLKAVFQ